MFPHAHPTFREYQRALPFSGQGLRHAISRGCDKQRVGASDLTPEREVDLLPLLAEPKPMLLRH